MTTESSALLESIDKAIWEYRKMTHGRDRDEMIIFISSDTYMKVQRDSVKADVVSLMLYDTDGGVVEKLFGAELKVTDSIPGGKAFYITDKASSNEEVDRK